LPLTFGEHLLRIVNNILIKQTDNNYSDYFPVLAIAFSVIQYVIYGGLYLAQNKMEFF